MTFIQKTRKATVFNQEYLIHRNLSGGEIGRQSEKGSMTDMVLKINGCTN